MSEKMKNFLIRTLSGAVLAAVMLWAIIWSQWSYAALLVVILVGGMLEFYILARSQGHRPQYLIGLVAGMTLFALNFALASVVMRWEGLSQPIFIYGGALLLLIIPVIFICELFRGEKNPMANIGSTLTGIFYIALPVSLMCYIAVAGNHHGTWAPWLMVIYLFVIWGNDVFAYLAGMAFGRHRMFERISPKKTWEGFFGGIIGAVGVCVAAVYVVNAYIADIFHYGIWVWIGFALVASITGVLGDLVESMFKRSADAKDSGTIIPGHGGILDRFDALLLSAPFVLIYICFVMA